MEGEIDQRNRHVTVLDDQNIELEAELDRFLVSDAEIRGKLKDRNRSPLRLEDLHLKHDLRARGLLGRPIAEPDLPIEPHSRVEVIMQSPYPGPPRRVEQEFRGVQTSPMNQRRAQYREQDTANHLRHQTAK